MTETYEQRVERLRTMVAEGRIIRGAWTDGHDRACLLAALSPEAGAGMDAGACPASVMPQWLAHLTPLIDDETSDEAWPGTIRRYADLAARWHRLDAAAWERARIRSLHAIVTEARSHCPADATRALAAIDGVLAWLDAGAPKSERGRARDAAVLASSEAWAEVAEVAAVAAADAAAWSARAAAARAASWAASAAEASARTASAARAAAVVAWDRMATGVLDAIEAECERAEVSRED